MGNVLVAQTTSDQLQYNPLSGSGLGRSRGIPITSEPSRTWSYTVFGQAAFLELVVAFEQKARAMMRLFALLDGNGVAIGVWATRSEAIVAKMSFSQKMTS
jgi:hypothetical protein